LAEKAGDSKSLVIICNDCKQEILQKNPKKCPYCGSYNLASVEESELEEYQDDKLRLLKQIEKLKRAGRYKDAALRYEKLEMWDEAGEVRRMAKTSYVISANLNIGKISTISMECPHCGASQPISSKNNEVKCKYCGKDYVIPKKVLELL
jgi:Zn finger protein HypA/HybF involved in hydrogenase expression